MSAVILGIDTSCDDTSCAVVKNGRECLSNVVYSQDYLHQKHGGVVPELASRSHFERLGECAREALSAAGAQLDDVSAVAVTNAPGLTASLLTGLMFAKGLGFAAKKPIIAVNHLEGHICANYINDARPRPPFLCLVVSGGHTSLIKAASYTEYALLAQTQDDAAGEAFDKTARALGLAYPGGAQIEEEARGGRFDAVSLPICLNEAGNYNFSFSGLKTAVLKHINDAAHSKQDIAASFQNAVISALTSKTICCAQAYGFKAIAVCGGVAVNQALRAAFQTAASNAGLELFMPAKQFCADNAAMVASRGFFDYEKGAFANLSVNAFSRGVIKAI